MRTTLAYQQPQTTRPTEPPRRAALQLEATPAQTMTLGASGVLRDRNGLPLVEPRDALRPYLARGHWTDCGVWHEMLRTDGIVQGIFVFFVRELLRARLALRAPSDADPAERQGRDLLAWWLGLDGFDDHVPYGRNHLLFQLALATAYGFSLVWSEWGTVPGPDGRTVTVPVDLMWVAPWSVDGWLWQRGRPVGIEQIVSETPGQGKRTQTIPASSLTWTAHLDTDGNPEGVSTYRPAWAFWRLKQEEVARDAAAKQRLFFGVNLIEQEGAKDGPWGSVTSADLDLFAGLFDRAVKGEVAYAFTPLGLKVKQSNPQFAMPDPTPYLRYLDHQILTGAVAGFLGLDTTAGGTRALSEGLAGVFYNSIESLANGILDAIMGVPGAAFAQLGRDIIRRNIREANSPRYRMPRLRSIGIAQQDFRTWGDVVTKLAQYRFITPDSSIEGQSRDMAGLEVPSAEEINRIRAEASPARVSEAGTQGPQMAPTMIGGQ